MSDTEQTYDNKQQKLIDNLIRFEQLRDDLFACIERVVKSGVGTKVTEGELSFVWPNYHNEKQKEDQSYKIHLVCYVIGPHRRYDWTGNDFKECLDKAEKDIREWISEEDV